jgi:hypothetical protein
MTDVARSIQYTGDPALARLLVQVLQEEGVTVEWSEPHDNLDPTAELIVQLVASGELPAIDAAVTKFRARVPHGRVDVEGEPKD